MTSFILFLSLFTQTALAKKTQPILVYTLGEEARPKEMKQAATCTIKLNTLSSKKQRQTFLNAIKVAKTAKEVTGFHIMAQVPSVHIWAFLHQPDPKTKKPFTKYLLYRDYETMMKKTGKEAELLISYARDHCLPKLKPAPTKQISSP
jgi:hypothetical protein